MSNEQSRQALSSRLLVPRTEAAQKIEERVRLGRQIKLMPIRNKEDSERCKHEIRKWSDYNYDLLQNIFASPLVAREYGGAPFAAAASSRRFYPELEKERHQREIDRKIAALESILGRLEFYREPREEQMSSAGIERSTAMGQNVFLVHGRDDAAKHHVARVIDQLGLHPVVLQEKPYAGRTNIEKFEHYADVDYAVVLLTPDDIGSLQGRPEEEQARARQNVIFELGYFVGKLGRGKVCLLYRGQLEIPSDLHGVGYVELDAGEGWKMKLAREMAEVGIPVDTSKLLQS